MRVDLPSGSAVAAIGHDGPLKKGAVALGLTLECGQDATTFILSPTGKLKMLRLFRLWRLGAQDLRLLWFAMRHPGRPVWLWPAAVVLGIYALEPLNFAVPLLGIVDDLVLLPLVLHLLVRFLPLDIRVGSGAGQRARIR